MVCLVTMYTHTLIHSLLLSSPQINDVRYVIREMYVFFSMAQGLTERLRMETLPGNSDAIEALQHFQLKHAHCWSKTDEAMLRDIISEDAKG